jgi:AcrR family transcriptional regulator
VTDAIIAAALEELADNGFRGVAIDAVARRAGVGKSALYRRWPSKVEMTADALRTVSVTAEPPPDTGSLEGDLRALLDEVAGWLNQPLIPRIYPDLLAEAQRNPVLGQALMDYVGEPRRHRAQVVLDRAAKRGEHVMTDTDLIVDALGALVFWRLIALRRPVTTEYLDQLTEAIAAIATLPLRPSVRGSRR